VSVPLTHEEEEKLVRAFFEGDGEAGFFVEVGIGHPTNDSQTWHLEQAGWTGVLVEPQPDLAAFLVTARSATVFAVACSSPDKAGAALPLHVAGPMSSLNPARTPRGVQTQYVIMVPVRTLDDILEEAEAPSPIDLLSLGVAGHEIEVLKGFDFAHWQPRLVLIEDPIDGLGRHRALRSAGYRLIRHAGSKGWYVPDQSAVRAGRDERWRILRTYYLALPFRKLRNLLRRVAGK
jgi:FkbM family methyltransferase